MLRQYERGQIDFHGLTLAAVAIAWLAGIFLASLLDFAPFPLLVSALILLVVAALCHTKQRERLVLLLLCCLCLGAWRYSVALSAVNDAQSIKAAIGNKTVEVRGTVADEPKVRGRARLLSIAVNGISRDGGSRWEDAHGELEVVTRDTGMEDPYGANYGDSVELKGKLQEVAPTSSPGVAASMAFPLIHVTSEGGNVLLLSLYHLRALFATIIAQALPQPQAALLVAILLGLRLPALTAPIFGAHGVSLNVAFNVTGTAHLIAPSGFKVTILAGLVKSSMRWFDRKADNKQLPAEKRRNWRAWLTTGLVASCISAYTVLNGASPSALRAGVMGVLLVGAPRFGRRYNVYTALGLTAIIMSAFDPFVLWDVGFLLSFLGTLGIVLLTPCFQRLLGRFEHLPGCYVLVEIIAVTLAAQVATVPIVASAFDQVSFVAPVANVLTVPLLGVLIGLGVLICGAGVLWAPLLSLCGWLAWPLLWYVQRAVELCADLPGAALPLPKGDVLQVVIWIYYAALILMITLLMERGLLSVPAEHMRPRPLVPRKVWRAIQIGVALVIISCTAVGTVLAQQPEPLTITFLDVGPAIQASQGDTAAVAQAQHQGEAILIRTPDHKTVLIDGGGDATSLAQALDSRLPSWQRSLDVVLLTCPRPDHLGGLQDAITRYSIGMVIDGGMLHPTTTYARWRRTISERGIPYVPVTQGMAVPIGTALVLQVLWPLSLLHKGSNEVRDNGLIIRLVAPGLRLLLLGASAQSPYALAGLRDDVKEDTLRADILQIVGETDKKAPAELADILEKVAPSLVVISPPELTPAQRKARPSYPDALSLLPLTSVPIQQIVQTAQEGTVGVGSTGHGWYFLARE